LQSTRVRKDCFMSENWEHGVQWLSGQGERTSGATRIYADNGGGSNFIKHKKGPGLFTLGRKEGHSITGGAWLIGRRNEKLVT